MLSLAFEISYMKINRFSKQNSKLTKISGNISFSCLEIISNDLIDVKLALFVLRKILQLINETEQ